MSGHIVVIGSINMDIAVRSPRLPQPGETLLATGLLRSGGGKGANQAVAAARAGGAQTSMIGAVGTDPDGEVLLAGLIDAGVDTSGVRRLGSEPTGTALITIDDAAENTIIVVAGANAQVSVSEADERVIATADVLLAQLEIPQSVIVDAASHRRPGCLLVLNAAPSARLAADLLAAVDLLVVNEHEAIDLAGLPDLEEALQRLVGMVPAVLVTLGADGARLLSHDGTDLRVAAPSVRAVDTVAAGDTFCGVYAAAVAAGLSGRPAIERACAAASLAIQRAGAQSSIPTEEETLRQTATVYG